MPPARVVDRHLAERERTVLAWAQLVAERDLRVDFLGEDRPVLLRGRCALGRDTRLDEAPVPAVLLVGGLARRLGLEQPPEREQLEPYDLIWIEGPLAGDDVEGPVLRARSTSIPVAVGETVYSLGQFRDSLARGPLSRQLATGRRADDPYAPEEALGQRASRRVRRTYRGRSPAAWAPRGCRGGSARSSTACRSADAGHPPQPGSPGPGIRRLEPEGLIPGRVDRGFRVRRAAVRLPASPWKSTISG